MNGSKREDENTRERVSSLTLHPEAAAAAADLH